MAKPKVLLVDDEDEFREVLSERLTRRGLASATVSGHADDGPNC